MKNAGLLLILMGLMNLFSGCREENVPGIYGEWEVVQLISIESVAYPKTNDYSPVVEFKRDGTVLLLLDRNNCTAGFTLGNRNEIKISGAGCTKICCDSPFSEKFIQTLPEITTYSILGNTLKLEVPGWGWFKLRNILR